MKTFAFSIKCWLTSVLLGTIAIAIYFAFTQGVNSAGSDPFSIIYIIGIVLLYSFILSIPAVIVFSLINWATFKFTRTEQQFRITASVVSAIIWFLVVFFFFGNILMARNNMGFILTIPYLIGLLIGIWRYNVEFSMSQKEPKNDDILDTPI